jgi:hypothetical protein
VNDDEKQQFIRKKLSEPNTYNRRYVAFLDLLGFSDMCVNRKKDCAEIKAIFNDIELLKLNYDSFSRIIISDEVRNDTEFTFMSDSIIISAPCSKEGLLFILYLSSCIQNMLLLNGVLLRGGIAEGDFYKRGNIMFGPAFISAYYLESKLAIYPRIIISNIIISTLKEKGLLKKKTVEDYVGKYKQNSNIPVSTDDAVHTQIELLIKHSAEDGFYFVNQFHPIETVLFSDEKKARIEAVIQDGLASKSEIVKVKYQWLETHFNNSYRPLKNPFNRMTSEGVSDVKSPIHDNN